MLAPLLPKFATERELNVGRGDDGFLTSRRGERVKLRTAYAEGADAWRFEVAPDDAGRLRWCNTGQPVDSRGHYAGLLGWDRARPVDRFLYALDAGGQLYAGDPNEVCPDAAAWRARRPGRPLPPALRLWHHSSFVAGRPVICAGDLGTDADGRLRVITNWSGHYHPTRAHLEAALRALAAAGVDLSACVAEVVGPKERVTAHDARRATVGADVTAAWSRSRAVELAERFVGRRFTAADHADLDQRVARGVAAGPDSFDPGKAVHWNWLARWVLEDAEGRAAQIG